MPYLGNTPSTSFATVVKDSFNGGSTAYTLSKVATTNSVSVFVENVRQEPTTAYSVSGTTLTFTATTPSGTGNIYVLHMNPTTTTTHPAAQNLTAVNGTLTGTLAVTGTSTLTGNVTASADVSVGDDLSLASDGAIINFGADSEVTLTHVHDTGLQLNDRLEVTTADNTEQLRLSSTDADASEGPLAVLHRNSSSPATGDSLGRIYFSGENDAGEEIQYVRFQSILSDASDGTEDGSLRIQSYVGGSVRSRLLIDPTETVFNDDSVDVDFRVESDAKANCFKVDAGNSNVVVTGAGNTAGNSALYIHDQRASGDRVTDLSTSATNAGFRFQGHETDSTVFSIGYSADVAGAYVLQNSNGSTGYYLELQPYASGIGINTGGSATPTAHQGFQFESGILYACGNSTSANYKVRFYDNSGMVGSILVNGGSTAFNTSSDYRLKENDKAMSGSIEKVKQLNPISFNFKSTPNVKQEGFFAHEIAEVVPQAVIGEKDAMEKDLDGETDIILPQQVDLAKVVPLLTSALKEAIARIEALESK